MKATLIWLALIAIIIPMSAAQPANREVTANLDDAVVVFADSAQILKKIDSQGNIFDVFTPTQAVRYYRFGPDKNLFVYLLSVINVGGNWYRLLKIRPDNQIIGRDSININIQTDKTNSFQFDEQGNVYYWDMQDNIFILKKCDANGSVTNLFQGNISVISWYVRGDGTVIVSFYFWDSYVRSIRKITPSGTVANIALNTDANYFLTFPDNKIYMGIGGGGYFNGVYKISQDLPYLDSTASQYPYIGYSSSQHYPEYSIQELIAGHDPAYVAGFSMYFTNIMDYTITPDEKVIVLVGDSAKTVVQYYPVPKIIPLTLISLPNLLDRFGNYLIIAGTKDGVNKLISHDLANDEEVDLLEQNVEIYHLDVLPNGDLLFSGLNFADGQYIAGRIPLQESRRSNGSRYQTLAVLGSKPDEFLAGNGAGSPQMVAGFASGLYAFNFQQFQANTVAEFPHADRPVVLAPSRPLPPFQPCRVPTPDLSRQLPPFVAHKQSLPNIQDSRNGWDLLTSVPAQALTMVDFDGNSLSRIVGNFPGYGLYTFDFQRQGWLCIHSMYPPKFIASDLDGNDHQVLLGYYPGYGLYYWNPYQYAAYVPLVLGEIRDFTAVDFNGDGKDEVVYSLPYEGNRGVYHFEKGVASSRYTKLHSMAASLVAPYRQNGKTMLLAAFPGYGLWLYNGTDWENRHASVPIALSQVDLDGDGVYDIAASFNSTDVSGVYLYNGTEWTQLTSQVANYLGNVDLDKDNHQELLISIPERGLYRYTTSGWYQLHRDALTTGQNIAIR